MDTQTRTHPRPGVKHPALLDRIEAELEGLRAARPRLASRIATAEHILTVQLSVANGQRPIRARLAADGSRTYRVRSNTKLRLTYTVDPADFSCDCEWQARGNRGCSHSIACWILERASRPAPRHRRDHRRAEISPSHGEVSRRHRAGRGGSDAPAGVHVARSGS